MFNAWVIGMVGFMVSAKGPNSTGQLPSLVDHGIASSLA